jgi:hypothetical protein
MAAAFFAGTQSFTFGGGDDPGLQAVRLAELRQMFDEARKHRLEDVGSGVFVQPDAPHHGIHQALVALHQHSPRRSVALQAARHQAGVVVVVVD